MTVKTILYLFVTIFVIISLDSLNINQIFKKNKIFQARLFNFFLALSIIYLVTNLLYDFAISTKII